MKKTLIFAGALLVSTAFAQSSDSGKMPGVGIYYFPKKDAMTDANQGRVAISEIYDINGSTFVMFSCRAPGSYDVFLVTKNKLMVQDEFDSGMTPSVMYRVDSQPAKSMNTERATSHGEPDLNSLTFSDANGRALHSAFAAGQSKVTFRILRNGMTALDYVFPANGFLAAFKKINNCR